MSGINIQPIIDHIKQTLTEPLYAPLVAKLASGTYPTLEDIQDALDAPELVPVRACLKPTGIWTTYGEHAEPETVWASEDDAYNELGDIAVEYIDEILYKPSEGQFEAGYEWFMENNKVVEVELQYD